MLTPPAGSSPATLSAIVLVSGSEDPLAATLESVRGIAEQIIVIDESESRRVSELCRAHAAERIIPSLAFHQGAAWNEGLAAAESDWVLCLEAGETLTPAAISNLKEFVLREAQPGCAYVLMIEIPATAGQSCGEQAAQIRLIPRRANLQFSGHVRPSLMISAVMANLDVRHLACKIQRGHREYNQPIRTLRAQRDLKCAEQQLAEAGDSAELFVARGEACTSLGQHSQAVELFQQALSLADRGSTVMLEAYYGLLSALDANPTEREKQLAICLAALDIYPLDAQLLCGMGSYMLAQNRPDLAVRAYTIAVGHGQVDPQTWHLTEIAEVSASCLSLTQQLMGEEDAARVSLEESLIRFPDSQRLQRQLLNLLIKQGASEAAMAQFNRLPASVPHREALRCAIRGALLASQRNWLAALPYLKTAHTAGCQDVICLRWLAVTLLSTGDVVSAKPVLHEWQLQEPHSAELHTYLVAADQYQPAAEVRFGESSVPAAEETLAGPKNIRIDTKKQDKSTQRTRTTPGIPLTEQALPDSPTSSV